MTLEAFHAEEDDGGGKSSDDGDVSEARFTCGFVPLPVVDSKTVDAVEGEFALGDDI